MMTRKSTPFFTPRFYLAVLPVLACALGLMQAEKAGGATVTVCDEASLRASLDTGEDVVFGCDGTIVLSNTLVISTSTTLNGNGHEVVLSGNAVVRIIEVEPGVVLTVDGVGIANGASTNGAGIYNHGSTVNLLNSTLSNNVACGVFSGSNANNGQGGAIYNDHGVVNLTNVTVVENMAHGATNGVPPSGSIGRGGGILNDGGSVVVHSSRFWGNQARGTDGGTNAASLSGTQGYPGYGGAIYNAGELRVSLACFETNYALGGKGGDARRALGDATQTPITGAPGGVGGVGRGGAIYNSSGTAWLTGDRFLGNAAMGGKGGNGSTGFFSSSGVGGAGALALGGTIFHQADRLVVSACTFASNSVTGGAGGYGGSGFPGGLGYSGAPGAGGGRGGSAYGGSLYASSGIIHATNNTLAGNVAQGSPGGHGGNGGPGDGGGTWPTDGGNGGDGGGALGGGMYLEAGTAICVNNTVAFNQSRYGSGGARGEGGTTLSGAPGLPGNPGMDGAASVGGITAFGGSVSLVNSIVAYCAPANCLGSVVDSGYNISSDASGSFYATGSRRNTDPLLGPLRDNGGPTETMELLPGSPAFNAGGISACTPMDQRGLPRPQFGHCDIGAFEQTTLTLPLAVTWPASNIVDYAATLNAAVNPNASVPATVYFEWGTTTNYGNTSPMQVLSPGDSDILVLYRISGIVADRDYHFRVVATNQAGISYGADQFFHTPFETPIVTTGLASSISTNAVTLNGKVNPHGPWRTTFFFEWGTSTNYGNVTPAQNLGGGGINFPVSAFVTGLDPYTLYHFRLVGTNQNGAGYGEDGVVRTLPVAVVLRNDETSLRTAMLPGEPISFAVDGTIVLTETINVSTTLELDGRGHTVILSGGNSTRPFYVGPGGRLTLLNLTIADGRSSDGAAIYNNGGTVVIGECTLSNNYAIALAGNAGDAGTNGLDRYPDPTPGGPGSSGSNGQDARGGAIYNNLGSIVISNSVLVSNAAIGGEGGAGGQGGEGGTGVYSRHQYAAAGGNGGGAGGGGNGYGGALYNAGSLSFVNCAFSNNWVQGGFGGTGGAGGRAGYTSFLWTQPKSGMGGTGGRGGHAYGGAIYSSATVRGTNSSYFRNVCLAGMGGVGGNGGRETITLDAMNIGGRGGDGGDAYGGACYNSATMILAQTAAAFNTAAGGTGAVGGPYGGYSARCSYENGRGGNGFGGGIANAGTFTRISTVIFDNQASGGIGAIAETNGCYSNFSPPYPNGTNGIAVGHNVYSTTPIPSFLVVTKLTSTILRLQYEGIPDRAYILQGAVDFTNWSNIRTNIAGADGWIEFEPVDTSGYPLLFFRAVSGSP